MYLQGNVEGCGCASIASLRGWNGSSGLGLQAKLAEFLGCGCVLPAFGGVDGRRLWNVPGHEDFEVRGIGRAVGELIRSVRSLTGL